MCTCPPCWQREDGEKESLTNNEEGAGKYQSVDEGGVSANGMQHKVNLFSKDLVPICTTCISGVCKHGWLTLYAV